MPETSASASAAGLAAGPLLVCEDEPVRAPRGIQSVEVGGQLLKVLARTGRRMALKDLAREAAMSPAKAHPYLVSFCKLGLMEQDRASGHYGLGPLAIQLGLISLQQADPVRLAVADLPDLAQELGYTVSAAIWSPQGPVIIRVEEGPTHVYVAMRHGTPASLRHTATGKIFAAFGPAARIAPLLQAEGYSLEESAFAHELQVIRAQHLSHVENQLLSGISALAAPVFDGFGHLVLALAAIGPSVTLDVSPQGQTAQKLQAQARALSLRLGYGVPC
ncbi:IclR family transcriptional regulator [Comamonas composti]|uniref:IclR family transcriptional regulator n=1 Tax=Comamonas composti TaxID=408558 RepID=UPI0004197335|nr:IclR family transcriptional regulator [Comamonas composti]